MRLFAAVLLLLFGAVYGSAIAQPVPKPGKCSATNLGACPSPYYNSPNLASQAANVMAYGADPTGVADSTTAINSAIATGRSVYLPSGTYLVTNALTGIGYSTAFYGDGPHSTFIHVTSAFSASAQGVLVTSATGTQGAAPGPTIHDLQIDFDQPSTQTLRSSFAALGACTTVSGGTGCKYPPAIYSVLSGGRIVVYNVTVGGAWDGFYFGATGNVVNTVFWLTNIEMGALDVGLSADGGEDVSHIKGWHSWPFGIQGTTETSVYNDGNTVAWNIGREDGLQAVDVFTETGNMIFTADFGNSEGPASMVLGNLASRLISIPGGDLIISGMDIGGEGNPPAAQIQVTGGHLILDNDWISAQTVSFPAASVSSGMLEINGGTVVNPSTGPSTTVYSQTGGTLKVNGQSFFNAGTETTATISSTAGGTIITNNWFHPGSGPALSITSDNAANHVYGNNFGGMSVTLPTGSALSGTYNVAVSVAGPLTDSTSLGMGQGALSQLPAAAVEATGFGYQVLNGAMTSAATGDSGFGYLACNTVTTGANNACFANQAGRHITTGQNNTMVGALAGSSVTTGGNNTFVGDLAGNLATGTGDTLVGQATGESVTGSNDVALGLLSAVNLTTGANNTCLGSNTCASLTTGGTNVIIGHGQDVGSAAINGEINIGGMFFSNGSAAPTLSSCGGGTPAVDSRATGHTGIVTTGTGSPLTSCTVTFATAYSTWSHCVVSSQTTGNGFGYTYSDSAITITGTSIGSELFDYACEGY